MHLHFDCVGGVSGDMLLGALCELHPSQALLKSVPERLGLAGVSVHCEGVERHGIAALRVHVASSEPATHRHLSQVLALVGASSLPEPVQRNAGDVFRRLAQAEAKVHDSTPEAVHFHEVGALDALVDIAGACLLLHELGPGRVTAGALPVSRGQVRSAHGTLPLPAPAVLEILSDWPVEWVEGDIERVTPTGAALLATLAECALPPRGKVRRVGCGAGSSDPPDRANVVRALLIETDTTGTTTEQVTELVCAIDDSTGEDLGFAQEILLGEGALDVYYAPRLMKKGRPGWELGVLCRPSDASRLAESVLRLTSSAGVRRRDVERYTLPRREHTVATRFGPIRVKVFDVAGGVRAAPEYEDCRSAAVRHGLSVAKVRQEALLRFAEREGNL